ncbi:hypothetical protein AB0I39_06560 [Kitasatospora purpeofusca]|uniref:hypothetical protein n=1 Tax=Kitasatospora purpeofusca TaxID=67352 RepID=UPI0033EE5272
MSRRQSATTPGPRGRLTVTDRAIGRIVTQAARDSSPNVLRAGPAKLTNHRHRSADASVRLTVRHPAAVPEVVADAVAGAEQAAALAGITLRRVRVRVAHLAPDTAPPAGEQPQPTAGAPASSGPAAHRRPRRAAYRWSERRLPAALLYATGAALCACGYWLLHRGGAQVPRLSAVLRETAATRVTEPPVLAAAAVLGLLGVLLLVLALTGSRPPGWRLPGPDEGPVIEIATCLLRRDLQRAVDRHGATATTTGRGVRVTATRPTDTDELRTTARAALQRAGFQHIRLRLVTSPRRRPPHTAPAPPGTPDVPTET